MSGDTQIGAVKRASWIAGFVAASALNLLSVSGIADALVDWRCFLNFENIVATYNQLRALLFSWLPVRFPSWLQHYLLLTASFGVMLNGYSLVTSGTPYSISVGPKTSPAKYFFAILFYSVPWIFLLWTAYVLQTQHRILRGGYIGIDEDDEMESRLREHKAKLSSNRRTFFAIVVLYPAACLGFLFLFSDLAYKVFQTSEIGGIEFVRECELD